MLSSYCDQSINPQSFFFFGLLFKHRCCFGAFLPVTSYKSRKTWDQRLFCQTAMSLTVHSEQPSITPTHFPVFGFASSLFSSVPSLNSQEANTFVGGRGGVIIGWTVCADHYTFWQKKWSILKQPGSNKNTHPYKWCNLTLIKCNITKVNTISEKMIWGIS